MVPRERRDRGFLVISSDEQEGFEAGTPAVWPMPASISVSQGGPKREVLTSKLNSKERGRWWNDEVSRRSATIKRR
jgi:hypothetical protein